MINDIFEILAYEKAAKEEDKVQAYCDSKALAERAIWEDKERTFSITTISPRMHKFYTCVCSKSYSISRRIRSYSLSS